MDVAEGIAEGVEVSLGMLVFVAVSGTGEGAEHAVMIRISSRDVARRIFLFYCEHLKSARGFSATNYRENF